MPYFVTIESPHAVAIDDVPQGLDLDAALAHACELIVQGHVGVAIQDGNGRSVRGDRLVACCNGDEILSSGSFEPG